MFILRQDKGRDGQSDRRAFKAWPRPHLRRVRGALPAESGSGAHSSAKGRPCEPCIESRQQITLKGPTSCSFCGARWSSGARRRSDGVHRLAGAPKSNREVAICEACVEKAKAISSLPPQSNRAMQFIHLIAERVRLRPPAMRRVLKKEKPSAVEAEGLAQSRCIVSRKTSSVCGRCVSCCRSVWTSCSAGR